MSRCPPWWPVSGPAGADPPWRAAQPTSLRRPPPYSRRDDLADRVINPDPTADRPAARAFFDLDRTLVSGSSGFSILIEMTRAGIVTRRQLLRDTWVSVRFRLWGPGRRHHRRGPHTRRRLHQGRPANPPRSALRGRAQPRAAARLPAILARARAHQASGQPVYLVTASSQEFADVLAQALALDGAVGTRSEIIDGRYTGRPGGPFVYGEGKVEALAQLADEHGLDLAGSAAYSDSISDVPMLRAVGRAVAVNPDRELRRIARDEGWEILTVDRLGRRLRTAGAAAVGLAATAAVTRRIRPGDAGIR